MLSMASRFNSFVFFFAFLLSTSYAQNGLILPIRKDAKTLQHYTSIQMGSNRTTINAVIYLSDRFLWFECDNYITSTYAPIPCDTPKCEIAKPSGCQVECHGRLRPGCTNNTCGASVYNPFGSFLVGGAFGEDTLYSKDRRMELPQFTFACTDSNYSIGLASGSTGMLGLGRTDISLHKQVATKLNVPDKFSLCLPSSGLGKLYVGRGPSSKSESLIETPLIVNPFSTGPAIYVQNEPSNEYFINVQAIRVNGQPLSVKSSYFTFDRYGMGGSKISTTNNFTTLHTSLYKPLVRAFVKATSNMKIKSVNAVAPFRTCFDSATISTTATGPSVPTIELVLPGNDVSWKIYGANSMFPVNKNVMCLAFVDGGSESKNKNFPSASIVIGTYQLEDNLIEFDLDSSKLRFSSSLLLQSKSCARL